MRRFRKGKKIFLEYMNWLKWEIVIVMPILQDTFLTATMMNDGILRHIKLPNILPEIFQVRKN
jgi:hypothetical protein